MSDEISNTPLKPVATLLGVFIVLSFCGLVAIAIGSIPDFEEADPPTSDESSVEVIEPEEPEPEPQIMNIQVVDYPNKLEHGCREFIAKVNLTNEGTESINYADIYTPTGEYSFVFSLNKGAAQLLKYGLGESSQWVDQQIGLEDFGTLEPGESKEGIFHGGGMVVETLWFDGTQATVMEYDNIFVPGEYKYGGQIGANELQLFWVNNYDKDGNFTLTPGIVSESEVMNVVLDTGECDETDIQKSEPL